MTDLLRHDGFVVRLASIALWVVVAAGPVLGATALLVATTPDVGAVETRIGLPTQVAGVAELAVLAYLSGVPLDPTRLTPSTRALRLDPSDPSEDDRAAVVDQALRRPTVGATVVAYEPAGPDRFGVQVLVLDRTGHAETWQVTVSQTADGPAVEGLPALVPAVNSPDAPRLGITSPQRPSEGDEIAATVEGFLRGLLVGDVDLQRYSAAEFARPDDWTPPTAEFAVVDLTLSRTGMQRVGGRVAVLAEVMVSREDGRRHVMQYPLLVSQDQGRWEVSRVLPALPLRSDTDQSP